MMKQATEKALKDEVDESSQIVNSYMRSFLGILQVIDKSDLIDDKSFYVSIVLSLMSESERKLLFYYFPLSNMKVPLNAELNKFNMKYQISSELEVEPWHVTHNQLKHFDLKRVLA